jgi:hypothetical protein
VIDRSSEPPQHLLVVEQVDIDRPHARQPQHPQIEVAVLIDQDSSVVCAAAPFFYGTALDLVAGEATRKAVAPIADADIERSGRGLRCGRAIGTHQSAVLHEQQG